MTASSVHDELIASLAAFDPLPDWLAAGMDGERVGAALARHVPDLASGRLLLVSCTAERLRATGATWRGRYRLRVTEAGAEPRDLVLVGDLWPPSRHPNGAPHGSAGADDPHEAGWGWWLPELQLRMRVLESDPDLPALPTLADPAAVARLVQTSLREAGYRTTTVASCTPRVVRYKPGSRCTVVAGLTYADGAGSPRPPTRVVLKTHCDDKGRAAWEAMRALWRGPQAWRDAVTLAEPLAYLPRQRILIQGPVPEECTLKDLARRAFATDHPDLLERLRTEVARTGTALAALHRSGAHYARTSTIESELDGIRQVVGGLTVSVPRLDEAAVPLLRRLDRLARDTPPDPAVPAHHDFRPAQVLLHRGTVGFIDFDGAAMAEPALDLGRFRAKLRDGGISALAARRQPLSGARLDEHLALMDDLCDHFLAAYQQHAPVSRERVLLWETCDLLTALLHAWTKVLLPRVGPRRILLQHRLRAARE